MLLRRYVVAQICCILEIRAAVKLSIFVVIRQKESGREYEQYNITDTCTLVSESASSTASRIQTQDILGFTYKWKVSRT